MCRFGEQRARAAADSLSRLSALELQSRADLATPLLVRPIDSAGPSLRPASHTQNSPRTQSTFAQMLAALRGRAAPIGGARARLTTAATATPTTHHQQQQQRRAAFSTLLCTRPSFSSSSLSFRAPLSLVLPVSSCPPPSARRGVSSVSARLHNSTALPGGKPVHVVFIDADGRRTPVVGVEGENLLALAHQNDVELEGACEASLACSTCHVILPEAYYRKLAEPVDEENDMLDLAFGLTDTSRLGCQVKLTTDLEGMEIQLPSATRNMAVDGFKPKPH